MAKNRMVHSADSGLAETDPIMPRTTIAEEKNADAETIVNAWRISERDEYRLADGRQLRDNRWQG